ncbi:diguanylate cyclase domain-containing protein [Sphingomonas sp.]|uniref:diguanylate cyclase domain-containing protein n=1 Tax=Sphingomonas sp. TaxID=28214 RepID=UPI002CDC792A|nr:diguanylate cyclase [Sphingomonas sp.]HTG37696.1 diguanylate cyclase [Sphingomonas sp.]
MSDPDEEARRIEVLRALDLIDQAPGEELDALAALAARLIGAPMGAVTLIDSREQHIIGRHGTDAGVIPREDSFCHHTIGQSTVMVVPDARQDSRFAHGPLVRDGGIRFYAGAPIAADAGDAGRATIGALCVFGPQPQTIDADQLATLSGLARLAERVIEARSAARRALVLAQQAHAQAVVLRRQEQTFRQAERLAMIGAFRYEPVAATLEWSDGVRRIHDVGHDFAPSLPGALDFYPPHARAQVSESLARSLQTGTPFDFETDFVTATGRQLRVRARGEVEQEGGIVTALNGVFQDVTTRWLMEQQLRRSAHVDALTGIANRAGFDERLDEALARARDTGSTLALVLIDLDGFKAVNDTHGHVIGDDVLRAYGQRLRAEWLADIYPARLGGDEFALIVEGAATRDLSARIDRLLDHLARPIALGPVNLTCAGTIGWARHQPGMDRVRDLLHAADTALYQAKRERRGTARAASA